MDYCHPCQRHLNGALACAGCGTPADALVPYAVVGSSGGDPEPPGETLEASGAAGHRRRARGSARPRRRRGHRRRGRALLLTAAGVVLALGALSLAELAMEPEGDSGASEYVSEATTAATEPVPSASSSTEPDDPGPVEVPTVVPVTDSHSATATGGPARTTAPGVPPSPSAPEDTSPPASEPADPEETEAPAEPSGSGKPTAGPTPPEPSDEPTPTPSPTETCHLWIFCF
ncbi:hypothetical protein OG379_12650 [Streptomyces sp. NBC_01166]|uniref:SCO2400 family protein n=1 Tax=Streptomyces sp. NBC_01166 TaxID=2903755 RepID=UPI00386D5464|nr:hypothetical protein OG379_12650 [Streptomyces sp. NBC_01166]